MNKIVAVPNFPDAETVQEMRYDLAASFRYFARLGMHESVANHFSVAVSPDGRQFLINPRGKHFSRICASDLQLIDADDPETMQRENAPDPTAWFIHSRIHRLLPHARCIMHLHPRYATALAALEDSSMPPIDQNTMRFFGRVAIDDGFEGMGLSEDEGDRLAAQLGDKSVLMMGNHGVLIAAPSVAQAMDDMYYYERSCETVMLAFASGRPLRIVSDSIAQETSQQWANYGQLSIDHMNEVRAILDAREPDYKT
ncbi:putative class II aldolase [Octadecabacter arcticus 238]|uniref:Putative class II aldolase n=1 Tax=Octadecabacter arcticus 238 TaxID=391616 RepID=M9RWW2_9RHOB|nr:class II aldolase/adducin family protein [Octadecabacter arcticus]AGI74370.1 putative class II aldolase [Octadecabacter arcticus 238]